MSNFWKQQVAELTADVVDNQQLTHLPSTLEFEDARLLIRRHWISTEAIINYDKTTVALTYQCLRETVATCLMSNNPALALRKKTVKAAYRLAQYWVLLSPPPPLIDDVGLRDDFYLVTGDLDSYILPLSDAYTFLENWRLFPKTPESSYGVVPELNLTVFKNLAMFKVCGELGAQYEQRPTILGERFAWLAAACEIWETIHREMLGLPQGLLDEDITRIQMANSKLLAIASSGEPRPLATWTAWYARTHGNRT